MFDDDILQEEETSEETFDTGLEDSNPPDGLSYHDVYDATFNAILDANEILVDKKKSDQEEVKRETTTETHVIVDNYSDFTDVNVQNYSDFQNNPISPVEFASSTDGSYMTVATTGAVSSADAQLVAYVVDLRNIVVLFFGLWLGFTLFKLVRNTVLKFTKGKGVSI